jgi:uncharacterized protein YfaS (alpha-2-macroglobulin family)
MVRWLLQARAKDKSWGSTNISITALRAILEYSLYKKEFESHFTLTTSFGSTTLMKNTFGTSTLFTPHSSKTAISLIPEGLLETITFSKENHNTSPNPYYYDMQLTYFLPTEQIAPRDEGIAVTRAYYSLKDRSRTMPLHSVTVGEVVRGVLTVTTPLERSNVSIEDFLPAGFELVNLSLATEDQSLQDDRASSESPHTFAERDTKQTPSSFGDFIESIRDRLIAASEPVVAAEEEIVPLVYTQLNPSHEELHDDRVFLFIESLYPGSYQYQYFVRATTPGTYQHMPAVVSQMYYPEVFGRTGGSTMEVK